MIVRAIIVSSLLVAATFVIALASESEPIPIRIPLSGLPQQIGSWQEKSSLDMDPETLRVLGVDDYIERQYSGPRDTPIGLYIGYYRSQRQGDTIHSPLNCLPGNGWNPAKKEFFSIPVHSGPGNSSDPIREIRINRILIQKGSDRQLVLYWYQSHGRVVASEYWGKIYTVLDAIRTNRTDAALVRVISPVAGMDEAAEKAAAQNAIDFVASLFPLLVDYLPD